MNCINPVRLKKSLDPSVYPDGLLVPCGKCIQCRIQKKTEWSMRLLHELDSWEDAIFITLTYDGKYHQPGYAYSLEKRHYQLFMKRLRKSLGKRKIKMYSCGEYGEKKGRPHYHAIIFGMSLCVEDKKLIMDAWPYTDWSVGTIKNKSFGLAEPDSIQYVAKYIQKKYTGKLLKEQSEQKKQPVFRLMSKSIGLEYIKKHSKQLTENENVNVRGVVRNLPRYYLNKLGISGEAAKDHAVKRDIETTEKHIGLSYTHDELNRYDRVLSEALAKKVHKSRRQHEKNLLAKLALKSQKL